MRLTRSREPARDGRVCDMGATKADILAEYSRARADLNTWLECATAAELRRRSNGTKWTNEELLFHMVFGYMVVRALLPLVGIISRLPAPAGEAIAALLNAGTRPFDYINYWGSCSAALFYNKRRMGRKLDATLTAIARRLEGESPSSLSRSMPFPDRWDPFFTESMTLNDVYAYPTKHFDFHARQLSLNRPD
jgi:DinB superfamily